MGEHSETFTLDIGRKKVRELVTRHFSGFGYRAPMDQGRILLF